MINIYKRQKKEIDEIIRNPISTHKPVYCKTTNKYFRDAKFGAKYYGLFPQGVGKCCMGKYKTCGEFKGQRLEWEYDTQYRWELYSTKEEINYLFRKTEGSIDLSHWIDSEKKDNDT